MQRMQDPYLRERMHDLDDLSNRLLRILTGAVATASRTDLPHNAIVVARNMGPAELLDYDRSKLRGVILEEAGKTSHVAIVARALGIPAIGQANGIVDLVDPDDEIIVDGSTGEIFVRPSARTCKRPMPKKCASTPRSRRSLQRCGICRRSPRMACRSA